MRPTCVPDTLACAVAASAAIAMGGCGGNVGPSWDDPTPEARIAAIERSTRAGDARRDVPRLVENLASDDAAVRMAAIAALERATGSTLGYRFDDSPQDRASSVARWRAWLAAYAGPGR